MLAVNNLEVVYNDVILVLRGISLEVPDGKIVALLGANGAGKTTVLRSISGLLDVHAGDVTKGGITLDGTAIEKFQASTIVHSGITQVIEGRRIFAEFTVDEKPLLVRFDQGNYLLKEWTFEKDIDELVYQLLNDDVTGKMWAASELEKFKKDSRVIDVLADRAINDVFWAVRNSALESWSKIVIKINVDFLKKCCRDENSKVRTTAVRLLGDTGDSELISFYKEMYDKDDSYLVEAETLRSIGKSGDKSQISYLEKLAGTDSPRNVIKTAGEWAIAKLQK